MTGNQRTLPRTRLLQQLRKHRAQAAFRHEEERHERLVAELPKARLTGIRVKLPVESLGGKVANLPDGVSVERGRTEVRFDGAKNALERLYSLAHALVNAYERFEALVDGGGEVGGGEVVSERRKPWCRWPRRRRSTRPRPRRRRRAGRRRARRRSRGRS